MTLKKYVKYTREWSKYYLCMSIKIKFHKQVIISHSETLLSQVTRDYKITLSFKGALSFFYKINMIELQLD